MKAKCRHCAIHKCVEGRKFGPFMTSHIKINIDVRQKNNYGSFRE